MIRVTLNGMPFVDAAIDQAKERVREHIQAQMMDWLVAGLNVLSDVSYAVALIGGGICIIVYAVTGIRRAGKVAGALILVHAFIRYMIGGGI